MDRAEELNKSSHILLDAEVRLNHIVARRRAIEKDIALMNMIEANLEENIRILKRRRTIVIVSDYRKSTTDIATCRARRAFLRIDRENVLKVENHARRGYNEAKAEYERCFELLHSPPNNVIHVDFSRGKNGRQE